MRAVALGGLTSPDAFKAMALGYLFLDVPGAENLTDVWANLDKYSVMNERAAHLGAPSREI